MKRSIPILALAVLLGLMHTTHAQYAKPQNRQQQPKLSDITVVDGKVVGFQQAMLKVVKDQQSYFVQMAPQKASIVGRAMPDVLAKDMYVNFTVKMDAKLNGEEEITALEVFTPTEVKPLGTQAEGDKTYAAGQITSINKMGKISVKTPTGTVKAQLAENCQVTLDIKDPSVVKFIREGDTVTFVGKLARPSVNNQPGLAIGNEFEIKLNPGEPLTLAKKKPTPKTDDKPKPEDKPKPGEKGKTEAKPDA